MKNAQLQSDIEKLLSYDEYSYSEFTTDYDKDLGYILDIKDNSYFYTNEIDRNSDYKAVSSVIESVYSF